MIDALVEFGAEPRRDSPRDPTFEDLDVDSLDLVELAQIVEDEYGVELKGADIEKIKTVGDVVDLVVAAPGVTRDVVITGVGAVTPARRRRAARCTSAGSAGESGIEDGAGRCREFEPTEHLVRQGGAPRRPLHPVRAGRRRRGARRGRLGRRAALRRRPDRLRDRHRHRRDRTIEEQHTVMLRAGRASDVSPLCVPLMMANAAAGRGRDAPRPARPVLRHRLGLRGRRARDRRRRADDPARRRRRRRHRRHRGRRSRRCRPPPSPRMDATSRDRHLAPVRPPPRRLRDGRGRRRCSCSRTPSRRAPSAAPPILGTDARLRRDLRRPPPDRARARAATAPRGRSQRRSRDAGLEPERRRLRQRPRHLDAAQRPRRDRGDQARARRARRDRCRSPRPSRRSATCSAPPAPSRRSRRCWRCATGSRRRRSTTRSPTRASTSTTCPARRARSSATARPRDRRSRTRSASAATTSCSAWRRRVSAVATIRSGAPAAIGERLDAARAARGALRPGLAARVRCAPACARPRVGRARAPGRRRGRRRRHASTAGRSSATRRTRRSSAARSARRTPRRSCACMELAGRAGRAGRRLRRVRRRAHAGGHRRARPATGGSSASTSRSRGRVPQISVDQRASRPAAAPTRRRSPTSS